MSSPGPSHRRRNAILALCALIVLGIGWALLQSGSPNPTAVPPAAAPATAPAAAPATGVPGVADCPLRTLPPEAGATVRRNHSGGPFPHPRSDGTVFGNREGHLPPRARGYYREYTVITPGARNRSTKRIVTGGGPVTDPPQYFYTGDHYDSFCVITDAGRRK